MDLELERPCGVRSPPGHVVQGGLRKDRAIAMNRRAYCILGGAGMALANCPRRAARPSKLPASISFQSSPLFFTVITDTLDMLMPWVEADSLQTTCTTSAPSGTVPMIESSALRMASPSTGNLVVRFCHRAV